MKTHLLFSLLIVLATACGTKSDKKESLTLFVGTYTGSGSEGIYSLQFNPENGTLDSMKLKVKMPNPSFLAMTDDRDFLYAIQETNDYDDTVSGGITAFAMVDGELEELNSASVGGAHPCHVALSGDGQLAASNYTGGSIAIYDINADGSLGDHQFINHNPPDTVGVAHAHKAIFTKDGLFVTDLGLDALMRYTKQSDGWVPAPQAKVEFPEGTGPRHFEFNADKSYLYVINETNATISVLERDDEGSYEIIQTEPTILPDFTAKNACADIHLSPDGKFLYGSNRGENTIVIFSVDSETGRIGLVGRESVHGEWPRNFTLSPDGEFLLVANQWTDNIVVFKRDAEQGTLTFLSEAEISKPVCLVFE
jgi:6-phosphogluconolactonase